MSDAKKSGFLRAVDWVADLSFPVPWLILMASLIPFFVIMELVRPWQVIMDWMAFAVVLYVVAASGFLAYRIWLIGFDRENGQEIDG